MITVLHGWDNIENARMFAQSEDLRNKMQKSGVIGKPDFHFLDEVEHVHA
jgi:hypothetical protein